jgi:hypothetical protein
MASRLALGPTQPPAQWVKAANFPEVKPLGRESDHSLPYTVEIKNDGAITLHGIVLS